MTIMLACDGRAASNERIIGYWALHCITCYDHANGDPDLSLGICQPGHQVPLDGRLLIAAELWGRKMLGGAVPPLLDEALQNQSCQLTMANCEVLLMPSPSWTFRVLKVVAARDTAFAVYDMKARFLGIQLYKFLCHVTVAMELRSVAACLTQRSLDKCMPEAWLDCKARKQCLALLPGIWIAVQSLAQNVNYLC